MSYVELQPSFYEMNMPESPWHAGAPGWARAPWVTWGGNPNQVGPSRQGVGQTHGDLVGGAVLGLGMIALLLGLAAWSDRRA